MTFNETSFHGGLICEKAKGIWSIQKAGSDARLCGKMISDT